MINQGYITILKVFRLAPLSRRCGKKHRVAGARTAYLARMGARLANGVSAGGSPVAQGADGAGYGGDAGMVQRTHRLSRRRRARHEPGRWARRQHRAGMVDAASLATHLAHSDSAAQALRNYGTELQTRGAAAIHLSRLASERLQQNSEADNSAPCASLDNFHHLQPGVFTARLAPIQPTAQHIQRQHRHRLLPQP